MSIITLESGRVLRVETITQVSAIYPHKPHNLLEFRFDMYVHGGFNPTMGYDNEGDAKTERNRIIAAMSGEIVPDELVERLREEVRKGGTNDPTSNLHVAWEVMSDLLSVIDQS